MKQYAIYFFVAFATLYMLTNFSDCHATSRYTLIDEQDEDDGESIPELETYEDTVFWVGCGCPNKSEYTRTGFSKKQKNKIIERGLSDLKERDTSEASNVLCGYYFQMKDMPKTLYWARLGAVQGDAFCMAILAYAYAHGDGIIQDYIESIKWTCLAAAKGRENDKKILKYVSESKNLEDLLLKAQQRATEWANKHPELFFEAN